MINNQKGVEQRNWLFLVIYWLKSLMYIQYINIVFNHILLKRRVLCPTDRKVYDREYIIY